MTEDALPIVLNGEPTTVAPGDTVASLLERLDLRRDGVAVAINRRVVPRSRHADQALQAGDQVEVITAVGGG